MAQGLDMRIAAVAADQHGAFSRSQAESLGFSRDQIRHRVRTGRWRRVSRNVFVVSGMPPTWRQRVSAAVLEAGEGSVASHSAAAALLGLRGFAEHRIEVTHPECRDTRVDLSLLHQSSLLPAEHVTTVDGIRCTTVGRTLFDLARTERASRVLRAVRDALNAERLTVGELESVVATLATRGRGGTSAMRRILDLVGADDYVPTESELEDLVLSVLHAAGVERPDAQVTIGGDRPVGRVDFLYRGARVVIEAQSKKHHRDWEAQERDMARRAELAAAGFRVVEVTWWQLVHEPHLFVDRLRRALSTAAA